jgi:hypothetical protein
MNEKCCLNLKNSVSVLCTVLFTIRTIFSFGSTMEICRRSPTVQNNLIISHVLESAIDQLNFNVDPPIIIFLLTRIGSKLKG